MLMVVMPVREFDVELCRARSRTEMRIATQSPSISDCLTAVRYSLQWLSACFASMRSDRFRVTLSPSSIDSIFSTTSATLNGLPCTLLRPMASTRYFARMHRAELAEVQLGDQHLLVALQDLAQVLRQRVEVPQVAVRDALALGLHVVDGRGAGAVGAAPAEDEQVAASPGRRPSAAECRRRRGATFSARVLTMC